jgi:hypothetical protein
VGTRRREPRSGQQAQTTSPSPLLVLWHVGGGEKFAISLQLGNGVRLRIRCGVESAAMFSFLLCLIIVQGVHGHVDPERGIEENLFEGVSVSSFG